VKQKLDIYQELLHKWQKRINLVSNNTLSDSWERHFEDSLQVIEYIPENTQNLIDIGSGAGFPGLVIAIARPEINVGLIESDGKKCSFLKTVSRETNTDITVHNQRIENVRLEFVPDIITARALASLDKLFEYCFQWIERNAAIKFVFLKGQNYCQEIDDAKKAWNFDYNVQKSKTDEFGVILEISNISRK